MSGAPMKVFDRVDVGDVTIDEVHYPSLDDADIEALNAFENVLRAESLPEDPPRPLEVTRADVRNVPDFYGFREFWGRDSDGAVAAQAYAYWKKIEENRHLSWADIEVRPDRRGRGIAKAMLALVADVAAAEGRSLLLVNTTDRVPSGEAFARRVGAEPGLAVHTNRLLLSTLDCDLVARWIADGPRRAPGYSLVALDGPFPDDMVEDVVEVYQVMNTAPRDDLQVEDERLTVEQMRQIEKAGVAAGTERWALFARHDETGRIVGLTEVFWNPSQPETIFQGDTGVHPDHRGHALGKWMKAVMLRRIGDERPSVKDVRTGNADSNDAMLGINRLLGFEPFIAHIAWQVTVERVRAYLEGSST